MSSEQPVTFQCRSEQLLGILTLPAPEVPPSRTAVLVIVGGPQYRAGSHRQFVQLARALAAHGHVAMRFDVRGMGDSTGPQRSFEQLDEDIAAAIDALHKLVPDLAQTVLWGLCDGASAALMYCARTHDHRVSGLALANPWLRSAQGLAKTHVKHYYRQRLLQRDFWVKLLTGGVAGKALRELGANLRLTMQRSSAGGKHRQGREDFRSLMASGWNGFRGPMLLLTSSDDYTAREFKDGITSLPAWKRALAVSGLRQVELQGADHTFSSGTARLQMEAAIVNWLRAAAQRPDPPTPPMEAGMHKLIVPMLLGALAFGAPPAYAQQAPEACGSVYSTSYGPYDYRKHKDRIEVKRVEEHHFTSNVENLVKAMFGKNFAGDFDYTLHAIPNHHRALATMARHSLKVRDSQPRGARWNVDCYFVRAMRFTPDDMVVRMLYADYLIKVGGRTAQAVQQLELVAGQTNGNAFTVYNSGLLFFEAKEYAKARNQAQQAAAMGLTWPGLREKLAAAGQWDNNESAAGAAGAASTPAAAAPLSATPGASAASGTGS